jgi:hypothetical protein
MKRSVPYAAVEAFLEELELVPQFVREVRIRAPRTIEVLVYAPNEDGDKHLGSGGGVALEARSIHIETLADEPDLRRGLRETQQIGDLHAVPNPEEASGR